MIDVAIVTTAHWSGDPRLNRHVRYLKQAGHRARLISFAGTPRLMAMLKALRAIATSSSTHVLLPDPDLFLAAAERLGVDIERSVVVGDSVWDLLAARRARALGVGLLSGGYGEDELAREGAYRVYQDPADLRAHLDEVGVRPPGG